MLTHFYHVLSQWHGLRDDHQWVLGAIIDTRGSVYRKTGALMLLSDAGHQLGLLSGGCLESDILLQARKVAALGASRRVTYDAQDQGSLTWQLGIGCGGAAEILLHPCNRQNHYLQLTQVFNLLNNQRACRYQLSIERPEASCAPCATAFYQKAAGEVSGHSRESHLLTVVNPRPHLVVLGKGADLIPLCRLACTLGWRVSLVDARLGNLDSSRFPTEVELHAVSPTDSTTTVLEQADAVVVAHHNMQLDAAALQGLQRVQPAYVGLLGPAARKAQVLLMAGLNERDLRTPVAGPMGLDLGGELPESIGLSVMAECHAVVHRASADALSTAYAAAG
jgi:xanthine dehydrogenase accessory factor